MNVQKSVLEKRIEAAATGNMKNEEHNEHSHNYVYLSPKTKVGTYLTKRPH